MVTVKRVYLELYHLSSLAGCTSNEESQVAKKERGRVPSLEIVSVTVRLVNRVTRSRRRVNAVSKALVDHRFIIMSLRRSISSEKRAMLNHASIVIS
jgi:uncharacterized OsmC-like protein